MMTLEEAREYWCSRLERAENYSDEYWDAEERHAHKDYVDAMTYAITALAICREHEEVKQPKTNGDRIRQMTDEDLADIMQGQCACCAYQLTGCTEKECKYGAYEWLKQEVNEDADK